MTHRLRDIARATGPSGDGRDPVKVFIVLRTPSLEGKTRARFDELGVSIVQTIGNKLVATAPGTVLDRLRADPAVAEVERSTRLRHHL
jgi:hypothetical protein